MRVRGLNEPKTTAAPPLCLRRVSAISYTLFILNAITADRGLSFDIFNSKLLSDTKMEILDDYEKEHVIPSFYKNKKIKIENKLKLNKNIGSKEELLS